MSRSTLAPVVLLLLPAPLAAQNLVPNPSFEQVTQCPTFASELEKAAPWTNPNAGTPELYHGCAPLSSYVSVPSNTTGGFQYARTGMGYAGLYCWRTDVADMREYAQVALSTPLQAGSCYRVRLYVNMPNDHPYACDGFGAHLSVGPVTGANGQVLSVVPQVQNPAGQLITDTLGWTEITGVYTAQGGETHLTIGNFRNDASTQTQQIGWGLWYQTSAYLLVDDVSVEELDLAVDLGPDTTLCSGGTLLLDATTPGATYLWSNGSTSPTLLAATSGTYWVTVSTGGCSASDTLVIEGDGPPVLDLPARRTICPGETLVLDAASPGSTVLWNDGDTTRRRTITEAGTYTVVATNSCGSSTATVQVVHELCPCVPYLPNAFTPDGDGINDRVFPVFRCQTGTVHWEIYDRWGNLVFTAEAVDSPWDGTIAGAPVPEGVYVWRARAQGTGREPAIYMGSITLVR